MRSPTHRLRIAKSQPLHLRLMDGAVRVVDGGLLTTGKGVNHQMLKSVEVTDEDDGTVFVAFEGDSESDVRSFWIRGRTLLERMARMCVEALLDQIRDDLTKETAAKQEETSTKKKAA